MWIILVCLLAAVVQLVWKQPLATAGVVVLCAWLRTMLPASIGSIVYDDKIVYDHSVKYDNLVMFNGVGEDAAPTIYTGCAKDARDAKGRVCDDCEDRAEFTYRMHRMHRGGAGPLNRVR